MTHANSVEQLDALLRLVSESPESAVAVSIDMRTEVAQLREAYHELAEHIQTYLVRSTHAEHAQQALQDRIQTAMIWIQQKQNQMNRPAPLVDAKYTSDSQWVDDIRADSKQVRVGFLALIYPIAYSIVKYSFCDWRSLIEMRTALVRAVNFKIISYLTLHCDP